MKGLSLRTKVFFLFAGATLLIVVPALVLIARAVQQRVYERATEELARAGEALAINWELEDEVLLADARVRALEPSIEEPLIEGDTLLLRRLLMRGLAEGRVALAIDSLARPLLGPLLDSTIVWQGVGTGSVVVQPEEGGAPLRVAIWPVWVEGRQVGVVGVGARLGEQTARRLADLTGNDVALVAGDSLVATTLPDSVARELRQMDLPLVLQRGGTWRRPLAGRPYLYRVHSLPTRGTPAAVLFFRPVAHELRIATGILQSLAAIGVAALVLGLLLAGLVARIVSRPAQALAEAAAKLARGDYGAPLPPVSGDEIGQLARTFGEMRAAIAEREARLRSAQAELIHREKLAAMGRLVAQLSHEINNPIYNIQNCLETLARRGDPRDPNREFLELAREELGRMATLTGQLLDQSRPLSEEATSLDLNATVRRVLTLAGSKLEERGIRVELALDPELPTTVAHPAAIQQVLANLVENAIDAMPGGGTLRIATHADEKMVEVVVEDSGVGISNEDLAHIFDAFYTTKPGIRGIGLGLFVSEGIIRGHRGRLTVQSHPGEGSRFVVQLPQETLASRVIESAEARTVAGASPRGVPDDSRATV
ncbi:MAG: ATP-binding protein [Gemmatimonadota bacterium]|nr:ATP-binding protein [Gemmatimonadota bacterium]